MVKAMGMKTAMIWKVSPGARNNHPAQLSRRRVAVRGETRLSTPIRTLDTGLSFLEGLAVYPVTRTQQHGYGVLWWHCALSVPPGRVGSRLPAPHPLGAGTSLCPNRLLAKVR